VLFPSLHMVFPSGNPQFSLSSPFSTIFVEKGAGGDEDSAAQRVTKRGNLPPLPGRRWRRGHLLEGERARGRAASGDGKSLDVPLIEECDWGIVITGWTHAEFVFTCGCGSRSVGGGRVNRRSERASATAETAEYPGSTGCGSGSPERIPCPR